MNKRLSTSNTGNAMTTSGRTERFSIPSIIAVIAAFLSFVVGAFWGFVLAIVAIIAAAIGMIAALSPSVRGGIMSMVALFAGALAMVAALIKAIGWLLAG